MSCNNLSLFSNLQLGVIVMNMNVTMDSVFGTHLVIDDVMALKTAVMAVMKKAVVSLTMMQL